MTITFLRTYDEALIARLAFADSTKVAKLLKKYGVLFLSVIIFLMLLFLNYPFDGEFFVYGKSYPVISSSITICGLIPSSFLFGWLAYKILMVFRRTAIERALSRMLPESFGTMSITISQTGLIVQAPLVRAEYDWKMANSLFWTSEYLFFCMGSTLLVSIPVSALGSRLAEFVADAEKWTSVETELKTKTKS